MIPEAREVHLSRKDRKVLEARCRSPVTLQRDLKRARIVLLAADGRSTRSIAKEVGVQPRIVSLWRHRYADHGLEGLQGKPRPRKQQIYTKTTDKRILKLLDKPPPQGFARWTGPLLAEALGDVDVQYVWRFLRNSKIDLAARKSWGEDNDPNFTLKAADIVGLYVAPPAKAIVLCVDEKPSIQDLERAQGYLKFAQWPRFDRPEPRLQAAWHDNAVCSARSRHRKDHRNALKTASPRRVSRFHEQHHRGFSEPEASRHPRQPQHPQEERALAQGPPQRAISFHADKCVLAQSGRGVVFDLAGAVAQRHLLHKPQAAAGSHRCLRQRIQRQSRALRLDQEKGPSAPFQRPPYHSALIPGTRG